MSTVAAVSGLGGYALNPRGNLWLNDDSNLGHKLLMKMGWSKGKGLGKNEDGIQENIKVKLKSSNSGVGWKDESFFKVQSTDYDSLLKSINENCVAHYGATQTSGNTDKQESLEQRSKSFRSRLHYRKFVWGKDVSKYSEKDMKSIFILNKMPEEDMEKPVQENTRKESETEEKSSNLTRISNLSISDYFAQKMQAKKDKASTHPYVQQTDLSYENVEKENTSLLNAQTCSNKTKKLKVSSSDIEDSTEMDLEQTVPEPNVSNEKRKRSKDSSPTDSYLLKKRRRKPEDVCASEDGVSCEKYMKCEDVKKRRRKSEDVCAPENGVLCEKYVKHKDVKKKRSQCEDVCASENGVFCEKYGNREDVTPSSLNSLEDVVKKLKKSKKPKLKAIRRLKSCLKSKRGQYCMKKVSFDECVSYRVIEPRLVEPMSEDASIHSADSQEEQEDLAIDTEEAESCYEEPSESEVTNSEAEEAESCYKEPSGSEVTNSEAEEEEDSENGCSLSNLPNRKSDYFNGWIESQRQAMKMVTYKHLLKSLKKHKVLKATNLLSIRGYGNCGL